jgi:ABC-2 type transport system ATP-binding protein
MSNATIEVTGLRKRFGSTLALDGMTFTVKPGRVTGFVGPNGAGKSTTIRVILGLDAADEGRAVVSGQPYRQLPHPLEHVGALIDPGALQPSRTGRNHLMWLAHSQHLSAGRVDAVIDLVGLTTAAHRKAGGYSLGMRQRLGIAAALLGDPPVIIMDEPFNGMDPEGIIWMRQLLRSLAAEGRSILVSSHLMAELQDIAEHIVVIGRGKVLADASLRELVASASGHRVALRTPAPGVATRALEAGSAHVTTLDGTTIMVAGLTSQQIVQVLTDERIPFSEVTTERANLEDVYLRLTNGEAEFQSGTRDDVNRASR